MRKLAGRAFGALIAQPEPANLLSTGVIFLGRCLRTASLATFSTTLAAEEERQLVRAGLLLLFGDRHGIAMGEGAGITIAT